MKKDILINILLLCVVLAGLFIIGEAAIRIFVHKGDCTDNGWYTSSNTSLLYELIPNNGELFCGSYTYVNEYGRRDNHNKKEFDQEVFAFVGDSITFGWRINQEETLPSQFEAYYNEVSDEEAVVLNFGVSGYNLEQEVELIKQKVLEYHPSRIFVIYYINDIFPKIDLSKGEQQELEGNFYTQAYSWILFHSRLAHFTKVKLSDMVYKVGALTSPQSDQMNKFYDDENIYWSSFDEQLAELGRVQDETNISIYYVIYPMLTYLYDVHPQESTYDKVSRKAEQYGLRTVPLLDCFRGREAVALRTGVYDVHPNAEAQEIAAQCLVNKIRSYEEE